jgi:putative peptidoglycan lipid II flippase
MMPGLWFVCMSALNEAFLKSQGRFFAPGCAPIAFNLAWALLCYGLRDAPGYQSAVYMSLGICLAYLMQWLVTFYNMRQALNPALDQITGEFWSRRVRKLVKPMFQGIIGVGATQINGLMDSFFALKAELAGPIYLWFAIRIEQAPLALIGLAISSAGLPLLARALERKDRQEARNIYHFSFEQMLSYMMPVCSAMLCLAFWGIRVAFERGDFQAYDSSRTALCLWGYSLGLMGQGILFLCQNLCFTVGLYPLVTRSSLYAVAFNIIGNWLCVSVFDLGSPAIAFTTTLATFAQLGLIYHGLYRRGWGDFTHIFSLKTWFSYGLTFGLCFLSVSSFVSFYWQLPLKETLLGQAYPPTSSFSHHLGSLMMVGIVWLVSYLPLALLFKLPLPLIKKVKKEAV